MTYSPKFYKRAKSDSRKRENSRTPLVDRNDEFQFVFKKGKHAGKTIEEVLAEDKEYLEWVYVNQDDNMSSIAVSAIGKILK